MGLGWHKNNKRWKRTLMVFAFVVIIVFVWRMIRSSSSIPVDIQEQKLVDAYSENDRVMKAIALSYFVYGCEGCEELSGTVSEILKQNKMGILIENDGIKRREQNNPASALFDTSEFIRNYVGDYRYLTDCKDGRSGFYGAAFCDDVNGCVWISYSGTVTFSDVIACAKFVLVPGLSTQEKMALELMKDVMESDEVKKQSYRVILTGHSLGGAYAAELSRISGYTAITINGADGLAIDKINAILGDTPTAYHISNYMTSPARGGLAMQDFVQRLMFLGSYKAVDYYVYDKNDYTTDTHCAFSFIQFENNGFEKPRLPQE